MRFHDHWRHMDREKHHPCHPLCHCRKCDRAFFSDVSDVSCHVMVDPSDRDRLDEWDDDRYGHLDMLK